MLEQKQSTRHLLMIEPAVFYANPETMDTNVYQVREERVSHEQSLSEALSEFRAFRDLLTSHGVIVTTALGYDYCPDMIFPNWMSTHQDGKFFLYPMLTESRRAEIAPEIIQVFEKSYRETIDWRHYVDDGLFLESTASIVSDHVNKIGYAGLSARTTRPMVEKWSAVTGYEVVIFDTHSHAGKPVYHTDFLMHIGTEMAGICAECIVESDRSRVLDKLNATHDVMELTADQLQSNCGNALEVVGTGGELMMVMSSSAYRALSDAQLKFVHGYYKRVLHSDLSTIEKYGGGSARCLLMEIFPVL